MENEEDPRDDRGVCHEAAWWPGSLTWGTLKKKRVCGEVASVPCWAS